MGNLGDLMNEALGDEEWQRAKKLAAADDLDAKTLCRVAKLLKSFADAFEVLAFTVSAAERVNCEAERKT